LRQESRRLKEEEIKKKVERKKVQEMNRKMQVLEKDLNVNGNLTNLKKTERVLEQCRTYFH